MEAIIWQEHDFRRAERPADTSGAVKAEAGLPDLGPDGLEKKRRSPHDSRERDGQLFAAHTPRLLRIAHRMLGSHADAEDLVQDLYIRWCQSPRSDIESPIAFLVTMTSRLCLDRLRERKRQRAGCLDDYPAAHIVDDHMPSPETQLEFSEDVSMAFLAVVERLGPEERVAFVLHDVLDYDYDELAGMLRKTEAACRQMLHRARARLRESRTRYAVPRKSCEQLVKRFLAVIGARDRDVLAELLAGDAQGMAHWINAHFLFDRCDRDVIARRLP